ncbi:hypothetical protein C8D91_0998 [Marinicella litoralis]|uniref:Uncharacterized protein n=2 Tax=Marinicella litoralis TaxID=644220 RepID=A0A4R6XWI8_9GAMM|nr:hypothetical protein C8D91_0998 [Marinicella litoralis]
MALAGMSTAVFANTAETTGNAVNSNGDVLASAPVVVFGGGANEIYNNGPLVNSVGTGIGGEDESVLQGNIGMNTLGSGHQVAFDNRIADDFVVTGGDWEIESIDFYAYQTNEVASTITAVNLRIWDGIPGDPGSTVIFGDTTTNLMSSTGNSGILRVTDTTTGTTNNRQIAVSNVSVGITLSPGTYWLDWQSDGTGASGPWAPPITINGETTTGNALQSTDGGVTYLDQLDSGTSTQQGFPFVMYGTLPPPPIVPSLSIYGLLLLALIALVFGRRFIRQ